MPTGPPPNPPGLRCRLALSLASWLAAPFLIAAMLASCADDDGGSGTTTPQTGAADDDGDLVELQLVAEDVRFDKGRLEAPAAAEVSLTLDNRDSVEHNFAIYQTAEATDPHFQGEIFAGPSFLTYQFQAPEQPGTYFFRCDIHRAAMTGEFVAE